MGAFTVTRGARKEAAQSLGEIGDAQAVKPLINLIEDSYHYSIVKTAVDALEKAPVRGAVGDRVEKLCVPCNEERDT